MQHHLTNKYQQNSPTSGEPTQPASSAYGSGGLTDLLVSISLSPGLIALAVPHWIKIFKGDESLMSRTSTHLILVLLALLAITFRTIPLSWNEIRVFQSLRSWPAVTVTPAVVTERGAPLTLPAKLTDVDDVFIRAAVPHTIIPDRSRAEISTYVVQSGDTIFGIAAKFGLTPETIMWANSGLEDNPDWLRVGQELTVLPSNGVYHQVGGSDTIAGIAGSYKVMPEAIIDYELNELDPDNPIIQPGQWLVVPGGTKPFVPRTVVSYSGPVPADATLGTGAFGWPTSGTIFQGYWTGHQAIDVSAWTGAPVTAADSGHVIFAGWDDTGYGYTLVIDHSNGFQTLYAHLEAYYVDVGDNVAKGQQVAAMGSSGNSTGPHLHFEVRQGTVLRNPVGFLP